MANLYAPTHKVWSCLSSQGGVEYPFWRFRTQLCRVLYMNFYEKALFVKPTWRPRSVV